MPNLKQRFSDALWNAKEFFRHPRKIHAAFPAITIFAFWRIIFEYRKTIDYIPNQDSFPIALFSGVTMAFAFISCYLGSWLIGKSKPRFWLVKYVFTIGIAVSPIAVFFSHGLGRPVSESVVELFRLVLLVGVTESIAGFLISKAQNRAQELESHQKSLILAEENFRSLVSSHLHDNLQTRLVAIGIQLNLIRESVDEFSSAKILATIEEIEDIRSRGIRDFGKEITPNFQINTLEHSLFRLFSRYEGVITCNLHNIEVLDDDIQTNQDCALGVFRIIEQALLNSLVHGKASLLDVYADVTPDEINLKIVNNGLIYEAHDTIQGHGFAVIDAWVSRFNGSWNILNQENQVVIEVNLSK